MIANTKDLKLKKKYQQVVSEQMAKEDDNAQLLNESVLESQGEQDGEEEADENLKAKMSTLLTDNTTFLRYILRMVQLFCEGQFSEFQDFLRDQNSDEGGSSSRSCNFVQELCKIMGRLLKIIHEEQADLALQVFATIVEMIQGPNKENIECLLEVRIIE